jgi:iron(II)-dependent oxidoreductase
MSVAAATEAPAASRKERLAALLERTRARTLELIEPLSERALNAVHDSLLSPIVWDLGHIAKFEELWLVERSFGEAPQREGLREVYDPATAPRRERGTLPYLRSDECLAYLNAVRERALACLERADLSPDAGPLLADGFVYELIARHEQQHSETILQTLQIMTSEPYAPRRRRELPTHASTRDDMVLVERGPFEMGSPLGAWFSYDNERPSHVREIASFWIDRQPVTNGQMCEFVEDGGYERPEWWSKSGWDWRRREAVTLPQYWRREQSAFFARSFAGVEQLDRDRPVCHVSWYEADAYARYAGKRLPSEAEWEKAASWVPGLGTKNRYPWGAAGPAASRANLDQLGFGTAPAGSYPEGSSACGVEQLVGDVWEWTASGFEAYHGFEAFPYSEYSEPFFGGPYKVLRGGAWATQPEAVSTSFRNWDFPARRQIFAGFRCARDAEGEFRTATPGGAR